MSEATPRVPLRNAAEPVSRPIAPSPGETYRQLGVSLWGKGAYEREPVDGGLTKYQQLFRAEQGDIVVNKIWARNGSVAVVDDSLAGCHGSNEFPMFAPIKGRLDPRWMHWVTKTKDFWAQCDEKSQGTSGQNRIKPERFLDVEIPLPLLDEQRRIVARIEELAAKVDEARRLRQQGNTELDALRSSAAARVFPMPQDTRVRDYVRFQTGYAFKSEWFVPKGTRVARNANVAHGQLDWSDAQYVPDAFRTEFSRFDLKLGDVLVSLDRPLISTGVKVARVRQQDLPCLLLQRVARAVFVSDGLEPDYLFMWLRSPAFATAIDPGRSNGVPHISHKDIEAIPFFVPPRKEQHRIVAELDALQANVDTVKALQTETAAELGAMLPAILDKAFKGEL